jgi:hypothetical protein
MKSAFYHDLSAMARRAVACSALLALASTLTGCSVSMPIAGFVDEAPTGSIAAKSPDSATPQGDSDKNARESTAIDLAAAQPPM